MRALLRRKFPRARRNVTVGRRWFWGGLTLDQLRMLAIKHPASSIQHPATLPDDPAAIIFTSGSTGPPKGVLYTHRMFDTQVSEIQSMYDIEPGRVDLGCFPLFALFNSAMGVTTVFPDMDFSRPATADPKKLIAAANDWRVTQAFASPAVWRAVGDHCEKTGERIASLGHIFSCGAPVPASVVRKTLACVATGARMHTPYGATECLPVSTIEVSDILNKTAQRTDEGAGVCVGRSFDSIDWRVIRITDEPVASIEDAKELEAGEIGELIVRGPQVSPCYLTRTESNATSKIADCGTQRELAAGYSKGQSEIRNPKSEIGPWHRMGDVGYLDEEGRFWYCGRKAHRVETADGMLFTECVEGIFNSSFKGPRSALVGVGPRGRQTPVLVVERDLKRLTKIRQQQILDFARSQPSTRLIKTILFHPKLPVDVRHNAKIIREHLATWAERQLRNHQPPVSST
jgi:acyl-CoA synthetase (AMP-forming)/AMP-acid ligase II